jgi:hypothetical protein
MRQEVVCGWHSGFPVCCIAFYATIWHRWRPRSLKWSDRYLAWGDLFDADYVMCPWCKFWRRVPQEVIPCTCGAPSESRDGRAEALRDPDIIAAMQAARESES